MHKIKRAAHRDGWYEDDGTNWSPYGKRRQQNKRDIEQGGNQPLQHVQSAPSPVDQQGARDFHLQNSGTFPSSNLPRRSREIDGGAYSSEPSNGSMEKTSVGDELAREPTLPQESDNKPRQRKMRKFLPWKHDDVDKNGLSKQDRKDEKEKKSNKMFQGGAKPTVWSQFRTVIFSPINVLLIAVPVGIALEYAHVNKIAVFVVNFIAIIPLAGILSYSTEELALYVGEVLGGLLNATFGNAVELIVSIIALTQHKILIVQTSLIGSMLSNLLLVLGMCFFFGGLKRQEQFFNVTVAQTAASLLALAIGSLIIPTAFKIFSHGVNGGNGDKDVPGLSRGTAILLLVTYGCYLLFQLRTHVDMYNEPGKKSPKRPGKTKNKGDASSAMAAMGANHASAMTEAQDAEGMTEKGDDEPEIPQLTRVGAVVTLAVSTVFIALCAEYMVSAIGDVAKSISQEFIGLILLPIVGNAAEHVTAVTVAIKDKMDLSIGVACGSSLQIALLVLPLMVLFNWWGLGKLDPGSPGFVSQEQSVMTLAFDGFQVSVLFIAVIVVNYLISDGKSHWLEGVLLMITYLIIAVCAYFYPVATNLAG